MTFNGLNSEPICCVILVCLNTLHITHVSQQQNGLSFAHKPDSRASLCHTSLSASNPKHLSDFTHVLQACVHDQTTPPFWTVWKASISCTINVQFGCESQFSWNSAFKVYLPGIMPFINLPRILPFQFAWNSASRVNLPGILLLSGDTKRP